MVVSSLFLKKMVTQTLQSGQRSHHLLFNYERDNFQKQKMILMCSHGEFYLFERLEK